MKNIGTELYSIIEQKKLVKKEIADKLGITPVYLSAIMKKESIDCKLLERICKVIGVSPAYFFDDYAGGDATIPPYTDNSEKSNPNEKKLLQQLLEEKERTIKILLNERNQQ